MRSPRPGSLLSFAAGLLLCFAGLQASAQMFAQPTVIATGNWPAAVYTADVNGDGYPDLIYIDQGATPNNPSTTHVLLNDGKSNFKQSATIATVGNSLAIGNMTGSGHVDIGWMTSTPFAPNSSYIMNVAAGTGAGTFNPVQSVVQTVTPLPGLQQPVWNYTIAGQIQTSGPMDLIAEDTANQVLWDFSFAALFGGASHDNSSFPVAAPNIGVGPITIVDVNGDGLNDLILNDLAAQTATVYLNKNGHIENYVTFHQGNIPVRSMLIKDVNGDGRPDLIAEGYDGITGVYLGNGDGTFQTTYWGGSLPFSGLTGNGGHLIAIANRATDGATYAVTSTPIGVSVLLQGSTPTWGLDGIYNVGPGHTAYAAADFNGDGYLDLAVDSPEGIAIIFGRADGSFTATGGFSRAFAAGLPALSGALGDFNGDGNIDAIVSTAATQGQLLVGQGNGMFVSTGSPTTSQTGIPNVWSVVQAADINGDGKLDIVLTQDGALANLPAGGNGLSYSLGNGDGTFAAPATIQTRDNYLFEGPTYCTPPFSHYPGTFFGTTTIAHFINTAVGVVNLDQAATRILSTYYAATPPTVFWSAVNGTTGVGVDTIQCSLDAHNIVVAGPPDKTDNVDVVVQRNGTLEVYRGSNSTMSALGDLHDPNSPFLTPGSMLAPDINVTFGGMSSALGFPAFPGAMTIADLDGDGNNDFIVTYANLSANLQAPTAAAPNYIYIWYGSGGGKFLTSAKHPVNPVRLTPSRNFYQVAVADMNGDGVPDLILSDGYVISVQLGKGDGTFGVETHYLGGQGINSISVADVNHDGKLDLVLANGGAVLSNPVANLEVLATNPDVNTGGITVLLNQAIPSGLVTTGTVTASPEPTTYGGAFTLIATVSSPLSGTAPTGTVAFSIDGNLIGSEQLIGTSATIAPPISVYSTLAVGTHTLTAVYSGDGTYTQQTFTGSHTVTLIPTTIGLALCVDPPGSNFPCGVNFPTLPPPLISPITMYFGQSIDGIATESESDLTGQIIFYNGTSVFCTLNANLQQGSMMCPTASGFFPVGNTEVTVDYTGDATHAASMSNAVQVIVSPDITSAVVTSSVNPSVLGQSVTFTANVQGNYAAATGSVTFLDGTTVLGTATLDGTGHATLTSANLTLGSHSITVAYGATTNFNAAVSPVLVQMVNTVVTGSVVVTPEPSIVGNTFTMTATVIPPPTSATTIPTGTVAFSIDGTLIGQVTLVNGVATLTGPATLAVGTHNVMAVYSGDTDYLTAQFVRGHAVILSPTTTTLLPTGATTIFYGQPADSFYSVTGLSTNHLPTGNITVQDNGVSVPYCTAIPLGSACPYADGGANKLTVGTHALVVLYLGDSYNAPSASAPLVFTVLPDTTTATLTSSDNPAIVGTSVTFTAKITGNYATPSGTVSFMDGATTLSTPTLDGNGDAIFTTSTLALGTHPITVVYTGNADFNPVTSAVLNQQINDGPTTFTITVTPTPITVEIGRDAVLQVKVTATGGFSEPVQLSCPSVPEEATCTFNQALIPAGGGITTLYFSPKAPGPCGSEEPYGAGLGGYTASGIALACLAMLPLYRRRRLRVILVSLIALCGLAAMSGCGHCTDLGTRPGNYTFTVMGTAQGSTPLTASQTVPLMVTTTP